MARRQLVGKKTLPLDLLSTTSCVRSLSLSFSFYLSWYLFSLFLLYSTTCGFATTIFTGLQIDERFSLKPIHFDDDSRYIRSYTLFRSRVSTHCSKMQRDTIRCSQKYSCISVSTCYIGSYRSMQSMNISKNIFLNIPKNARAFFNIKFIMIVKFVLMLTV